jgi:hypothetical protein
MAELDEERDKETSSSEGSSAVLSSEVFYSSGEKV